MQFVDLRVQQARIRDRVDAAIARVLDHGAYILGPEVAELEKELATFCGARRAVSCASGTDALLMALMAKDVKPGDAVFVPAFTFVATAEAISVLGAIPIFIDVDPDYFLMSVQGLKDALNQAKAEGLKPKGIVPVDLFGQPADYFQMNALAVDENLFVLADAAQSFGGAAAQGRVGALAEMTATSFFPAKPLGCYGDGGALFCDDDDLAERFISIRAHGKGDHRYQQIRIGINGRLDTLQAAILLEKLKIFEDEIKARNAVAERYNQGLRDRVAVPEVVEGATSAWAQYTIRLADRDGLANALKEQNIPTAVYYPLPLNKQPAYKNYPSQPGGCPVADRLSDEVISLPMHPYLEEREQQRVIDAVVDYMAGKPIAKAG
jgi:dTDP-4-amino-4,6-dideoxygalactose transaminase